MSRSSDLCLVRTIFFFAANERDVEKCSELEKDEREESAMGEPWHRQGI